MFVKIASPCPISWDSMKGTDRVRFCGECKRKVFNLSEMTQAEAKQLLSRHRSRLCAMFYKRADGTVMTRDCPEYGRRLRRRIKTAALMLASLLAMLFGAASIGKKDENPFRKIGFVDSVFAWFEGPPKPVPIAAPPPPPPRVLGAVLPPRYIPPTPQAPLEKQ
jgi:hypothetical protein